jgi:HEAT repeat protein
MLRDSSWRTRLAAANSLRTMGQLSVPRRAALLAEAIDREAAAPTSGPPFAGSYLPLSSVLRLQYLGLLEELGAPAADAVGSAAAPVSPAGREWRTLAVAATGDPKGAPVIRELLASSDPAVRMTAARYLGYLRDRDAIPALRRALTDPFTATAVEDAPGRRHAPFYPVRQQAARALRVLGVVVERRGDSYTVK